MPMGYRSRLAPTYLAQVYRSGQPASTYAANWLKTHSLEKCAPAQEMISIMEAVDDSIVQDERDVINSVAFEKLARRAYGLERAYEDVKCEEDWRRPEAGNAKAKGWKSKVKWDLCERYDTRGHNLRPCRVPGADSEANEAMERDASFNKYYTKMVSSASERSGG